MQLESAKPTTMSWGRHQNSSPTRSKVHRASSSVSYQPTASRWLPTASQTTLSLEPE